jgi:hypothetical protein
MLSPSLVQDLRNGTHNFLTHIHVGREFNVDGAVPRLGDDIPRWYGETIGFWDGDVLVTWTSNIQGWIAHGAFEFSSRLQSIEIYSPIHDADGNTIGIEQDAILYDPEALVEPVRIVQRFEKTQGLGEGPPVQHSQCIQVVYPIDGIATSVGPNDSFEFSPPDIYGRPWARMWEKYHEQGLQRPETESLFGF